MPSARHSPRTAVAALLVLCALSGCSTAVAAATVAAATPTVGTMSPTSGALAGGNVVTFSGSGLHAVSSIEFDGVAATDVTVVDASTVTAVVPHAAEYVPGSVTVSVAVTGGKTATFGYEYQVLTGVDRQMQYAFQHWNDYNVDEYGDFNDSGGDCQNFVSQTLVARGWATTDDWFNDDGEDWAQAFVYAPAFDDWIANAGVGATRLSADQIDQVKIGDIVMLDWNNNGSPDHVQVVSGIQMVNGVRHILMVGHNIDDDYRDLQTAITVDHPGATEWFWSLPAG